MVKPISLPLRNARQGVRVKEMRASVRGMSVIVVLAASLACNQTASVSKTPPVKPQISISTLYRGGFLANRMVLAATSMPDLLGLVYSMHSQPTFDDCYRWIQLQAPIRKDCWADVKDPGNSLLIAAQVIEACLSTNSITGIISATNTLTITVVSSGQCAPGSGMQAAPSLSLLSIPLDQLPADEVRINLLHTYLHGSFHFLPELAAQWTVVDLRHPLDVHNDVQVRMAEVGSSIGAAEADALNRLRPDQTPYPEVVGTARWIDGSLGCPDPGQTYEARDARGFVILLSWFGQPSNSAFEYHISARTVVYCGQVPIR
jgi:hypothetical protein